VIAGFGAGKLRVAQLGRLTMAKLIEKWKETEWSKRIWADGPSKSPKVLCRVCNEPVNPLNHYQRFDESLCTSCYCWSFQYIRGYGL
jgi:hypothetical protein